MPLQLAIFSAKMYSKYIHRKSGVFEYTVLGKLDTNIHVNENIFLDDLLSSRKIKLLELKTK